MGSVAADDGVTVEAYQEFLQLVDALRARGAIRVRDGSLECDFAREHAAPATATSTSRSPNDDELAELAELRVFKSRFEEMP